MSSTGGERARDRSSSTRPEGVRSLRLGATLMGATLFVTAALWLQLPFANGPRQWEWPYRGPVVEAAWLGVLLLGVALIPALRLAGPAWRRLLLITVLGWALSLAALAAEPGGMERVIRSLVSRHVFSYVFDAGQFAGAADTVRAYPEGIERLSMHTRTHPPGTLLAIQLLDRLVPAIRPERGAWIETARSALDEELHKVRVRRRPVPRHLPSAATVVVLALLLPAASAFAALPLFLVARDVGLDDDGALAAAALWSIVPARSLFTPSLDQALPALLLLALYLAGRRRLSVLFVGGMLWGATCLLTYGLLSAAPLLLFAALFAGDGAERGALSMRRVAVRTSILGGGFVLPWLGLVLLGFAPWASFVAAMGEHRTMVTSQRAYTTWLVFNPWDLVLFLGVPVVVLAAWDLSEEPRRRVLSGARWRPGLSAVWWLLLLALLVSGTVRGEAGRIWLFLMPFGCLFAARTLSSRRAALTAVALVLQCLVLLSLAANLDVVT